MEERRNPSKAVLTVKETAREYHFPEHTLRTLIKQGIIPVIRSGNRSYVVPAKFEEYLAKGGEPYGE